jgi:hypothetical protein
MAKDPLVEARKHERRLAAARAAEAEAHRQLERIHHTGGLFQGVHGVTHYIPPKPWAKKGKAKYKGKGMYKRMYC